MSDTENADTTPDMDRQDPDQPGRTSAGQGGDDRPDEPTVSELREPSTEKDVGEEPKAPGKAGQEGEPEPSHRAEGIGVIAPDRPGDEAPL